MQQFFRKYRPCTLCAFRPVRGFSSLSWQYIKWGFIPIASYRHIQTIWFYHHSIALGIPHCILSEFWFHVIAIRRSFFSDPAKQGTPAEVRRSRTPVGVHHFGVNQAHRKTGVPMVSGEVRRKVGNYLRPITRWSGLSRLKSTTNIN